MVKIYVKRIFNIIWNYSIHRLISLQS